MKDKNAIQNMSTKALLDELETRGIKFRTVPVQPNDTPEFIGQMVDIVEDFLEEKGVPRVCIMQTRRIHTLYYFQYSSVPTRQIYDILYYDNCWCLSRKREKYEQLLTRNLKI